LMTILRPVAAFAVPKTLNDCNNSDLTGATLLIPATAAFYRAPAPF
jgi:hypothetical protein